MEKTLDIVAIGSCYVDTNLESFPFERRNLTTEEIIGGPYQVVPGGSAVNFCRLGHALGARTAFVGIAGDDEYGKILDDLLAAEGVQSDIVHHAGLQTNIGFNLTSHDGDHLMFIAGTANAALSPEAVLPKLTEALPRARMLYMGGCFKLKSFAHAFSDMATLAKQHGAQVAVDHGRIPDGVSDDMREAVKRLVLGASYYFPSREEFCALWQVGDIAEGLATLASIAPGLIVIVKDGSNGAHYWADGAVQHVAAPSVENVVNATGAGDSFNAGAMVGILGQRTLDDAVGYACRVAAAKISGSELPLN